MDDPGQVIAIDPNGPFWVVTGDGQFVRVTRYQIHVYIYTTDRLDRLMSAFGLSLPVRLCQIPIIDGHDATIWERGIRAWNAPAPNWRLEPIARGEKDPTEQLIDLNRPFVHSLFALLGITRGHAALDVGCGDGWAMSLFQEVGLHCSGFDVAPQSLRIARRQIVSGSRGRSAPRSHRNRASHPIHTDLSLLRRPGRQPCPGHARPSHRGRRIAG